MQLTNNQIILLKNAYGKDKVIPKSKAVSQELQDLGDKKLILMHLDYSSKLGYTVKDYFLTKQGIAYVENLNKSHKNKVIAGTISGILLPIIVGLILHFIFRI